MAQGICKMCGNDRPLIDAHIIPESFFREFGQDRPVQYSTLPNEYPKLRRRGPYDGKILCAECERLFQDFDNYAPLLLRLPPPARADDKFLRVPIDYPLLKLFFISVLWRAHVSGERFYDKVSIGDMHAARLCQMVQSRDPGGEDDYATWVFHFDMGNERACALPPHPLRADRIRCYRFFIVGITWVIKVDSRPTPLRYRHLVMCPNQPLLVRRLAWETSQERALMLKTVPNVTESRNMRT